MDRAILADVWPNINPDAYETLRPAVAVTGTMAAASPSRVQAATSPLWDLEDDVILIEGADGPGPRQRVIRRAPKNSAALLARLLRADPGLRVELDPRR